MSPGSIERCPSCGSVDRVPEDRVPFERIWQGLRETWSAEITSETRTRLQPAASTSLVRCAGCGLEYFFPAIAGDSSFYEQLSENMAYHGRRWEFSLVTRSLPSGLDLIDFGCGDGSFLRLISTRMRRVVGLDHNDEAIRRLQQDGIEAFSGSFEAFAERNRAAFGVACSFHTLEHLSSVDELMGPALTCLRPGGRLFLSVPNADRLRVDDFEPLDHPPHHVSRWRAADLAALCNHYPIDLVGVHFEEPGYHAARAWRASRSSARHLALGPVRYLALRSFHRFAASGAFGHAMLAEFRTDPVR
jgi:2-polyprenyl-3-methyl-5-hydroxy-6-metoxy-1,4-benzoquinol methylase